MAYTVKCGQRVRCIDYDKYYSDEYNVGDIAVVLEDNYFDTAIMKISTPETSHSRAFIAFTRKWEIVTKENTMPKNKEIIVDVANAPLLELLKTKIVAFQTDLDNGYCEAEDSLELVKEILKVGFSLDYTFEKVLVLKAIDNG